VFFTSSTVILRHLFLLLKRNNMNNLRKNHFKEWKCVKSSSMNVWYTKGYIGNLRSGPILAALVDSLLRAKKRNENRAWSQVSIYAVFTLETDYPLNNSRQTNKVAGGIQIIRLNLKMQRFWFWMNNPPKFIGNCLSLNFAQILKTDQGHPTRT